MKIHFYGAAREVGRSCIMIESKNTRVLLDAGIKLGTPITYPELKDEIIPTIDAILITHAHLDHCGYLPHIYSKNYSKPLYATKPTIELMQVMLSDYLRISNPKGLAENAVARVIKNSKIAEYKRDIKIKDLTVTFIPAGHVLGSAMIRVSDGKDAVVYTGDINLSKTKLLNGAEFHSLRANALILESTNGAEDDNLKTERENIKQMAEIVKSTLLAGGKVIIPSFGVGRAQEVMLILDDYMNSGIIPKVPIFIDGVINKIARIHRHNVILCRKELQMRILMSDSDPFKSDNFVPVEKQGMRNKIVSSDTSSIIVTTSGMLTGGPIFFYLPRLAKDKANAMILIGYQAAGTLGRAVLDGERDIEINKKKVHIEMSVSYVRLSAHADRKQIESVPKRISGVKKIFLVHGETSKMESLNEELSKHFEVIMPVLGSSHKV